MSDESKGLVKWKAALVLGVGAVALAGGALLAYSALTRSRRAAKSEENAGEAGTSPQGTPTNSITKEGTTNSGTTSQVIRSSGITLAICIYVTNCSGMIFNSLKFSFLLY